MTGRRERPAFLTGKRLETGNWGISNEAKSPGNVPQGGSDYPLDLTASFSNN